MANFQCNNSSNFAAVLDSLKNKTKQTKKKPLLMLGGEYDFLNKSLGPAVLRSEALLIWSEAGGGRPWGSAASVPAWHPR